MFSFISDFFNNLLFSLIIPGLGIGVCSLLFSIFIPSTLAIYKIPAQILGIVLCVFFLFTAGRFSEHKKHEAAVAEFRLELASKEALANKISTKTLIQFIDRIKVVEKIKEVPTYVYVTKENDAACRIDPDTASRIRMLLDSAAKGKVPGSASDTNAATK